jgi:hypothetical protein
MKIMLCQISNEMINPESTTFVASPREQYHRTIWDRKQQDGYWKPKHFWELPLWIGEVTYALKEHHTVSLQVLNGFHLQFADAYCFSALDANKDIIKTLANTYPTQVFYVGGYVDPAYFNECTNIIWCDSVEMLCCYLPGYIEYKYGVDWSLFEGEKCMPRLTMSYGCSHHCKFCTIPDEVKEVSWGAIVQQVNAMRALRFKLVYLNDKTWGMANNHNTLDDVYAQIKAFNPEFEGFVVQTSVALMQSFQQRIFDELDYMKQAGVKIIELGIETFNDELLRKYRKPQREKSINHVVQMLSERGFKVIANIILGLPGETDITYGRTYGWLHMMRQYLYGINLNVLALYHDSQLGKDLGGPKDHNDTNQLGDERSFWTASEKLAYSAWRDHFYKVGALVWTMSKWKELE